MISKQEKVIQGLRCCGRAKDGLPRMCNRCPYDEKDDLAALGMGELAYECRKNLINDAYEVYIKQRKEEKAPAKSMVKKPIICASHLQQTVFIRLIRRRNL